MPEDMLQRVRERGGERTGKILLEVTRKGVGEGP